MSATQPLPWTAESVVRRRREIIAELVAGHPSVDDLQELCGLSRQEAREVLAEAVETYCELRALARELKRAQPAASKRVKRRSVQYQALKRLQRGLGARLEHLETAAVELLPFTFERGRFLNTGVGVEELVGDVPDDVVDEIFPPLAGEVDA